MAEILLSDYFAANAAAADDATDCTKAIKAALVALNSAGGGAIRFPSGICRVLGKIHYLPFVPVTLLGGGDSVVKVMGGTDRPIEIGAQSQILAFENMTFVGETKVETGDSNMYSSSSAVIFAQAKLAAFRNCRFFGVATSGSDAAAGVVTIYNCNAVFEKCQFDGCAAPGAGVVRGIMAKSITFRDCSFIDWVSYGDDYYSKTPGGNESWILADSWAVEGATTETRRLVIESCYFDEGVHNSIVADGADLVDISGVGINFGTTRGIHLKNVRDARIKQTWIGYAATSNLRGIVADNVHFLRLEGLKFDKGVNHIELIGTTKRVVLENCYLQGNADCPNGVKNTANALLEIDGVKYRNGMAAY